MTIGRTARFPHLRFEIQKKNSELIPDPIPPARNSLFLDLLDLSILPPTLTALSIWRKLDVNLREFSSFSIFSSAG